MIGKWNKSVILSYIGLTSSISGIFLAFSKVDIKYLEVCLIIAGICDLFDGTIARRCKRTEEEKLFGIELDSLIDVINFLALPIGILLSLINKLYVLPIIILYALFGVARLAYFNITTEDTNKPRKYYEGLPVTYAALVFPISYLLSYILEKNLFNIIYLIITFVVAVMFIVRIKIPKPKLKASILLLLIAIIISILYIFVL